MWSAGKSGFSVGHLRRRLRLEKQFLTRDLADMMIYRSPLPSWPGQSMAEIYSRYQVWLRDGEIEQGNDSEELETFRQLGPNVRDDGEFFLALLRHFDRDLHWYYVNANRDPETIKRLLLHPKLLPGFNDSGAHVTNMAYYDGNLRALRIGLEESEACFSHMVHRLTQEPADFFGLDVGRLSVGARADVALIHPEALRTYDGEANIQYIYRELFDCHQLVNRSDGVVGGVYVNGQAVWNGTGFTEVHGKEKLGGALRVGA